MLTTIDNQGVIMRIAIWLLSAAAALYGLAVAVLGIVHVVAQVSSRAAIVTVEQGGLGFGDFTSVGDAGIGYGGTVDQVTLSIQNPPTGLLLLNQASSVCTVLVHIALAVAAVLLGRALLRSRPFDANVATALEVSVLALLGFGLAAQGLDWAADVAILDYLGDHQFSRAFTFEPLVVTGALALALVAVAFRSGTRMQRDTEGLI
jgi:hypothetical protein